MKIYNTKEIAELLGVDNETVRRWIRSGELKAEQLSRKQGNIVYEKDLLNFISDKPKYKKIVSSNIQPINNTFLLNDLLNDLIIQRDLLNDYITKVQSLMKEES